ncbi:hypothetical protein [Neomesorhizobium albiziae]|uniref:hypothetical protein n=1 Tax=Neomesorhizobium albiziae TaxID=335020 RepID=UPI00165FFD43|nr:hypothetical protein [Mesorhizobium albiziae]
MLSTLQFPTSSRQIYGDAAMPNVKSRKGGLGMSSAASIEQPFHPSARSSLQKYGDAAPRADVGKASNGAVVGKPWFAIGRRVPSGNN